jgi:hypothetical protein
MTLNKDLDVAIDEKVTKFPRRKAIDINLLPKFSTLGVQSAKDRTNHTQAI